jgi:TP901 family phage tail tape measure protein
VPREIWSIQLEVTLQKALAQLSILEKRLIKIETRFKMMGAGVSPKAAASMTVLGAATKKAGTSATVAQGKFATFFTTIKAQGSSFVTVLARRFAFMAAAMVELFAFAFVLAIPAAIAKSIQAGAAFEDAMLRTATVASGGLNNLQENYALLAGAARAMAIEVAFSATEVASAMFEMVSSGLTTTQTIEAMPAVLNFAGAAMTDLTTSVDIMTQVMKSFGLEADDLDDIADTMIVALNLTTLNVDRLQAAFRFAAPAGGAFKQSIEDTVIVMSLFVDATKQGGIAGRAFRFMMSSLAAPSNAAIGIFSTLRSRVDQSRVSMEEVALTQKDGSPRSIVTILRTLANTTITSAQVLEAFGTRSGPIVALALVRLRDSMKLAADGSGEFEDMFTKMEKGISEGKRLNIAEQQYSRFMQSLSNQFKLLGAIAEEAMLKISTRIGPTVLGFVKFVQAVVNSNAVISLFMAVAKDMATAVLFLAVVAIGKGIAAMVAWVAGLVANSVAAATASAANLGLAATLKAVALSVPGLLLILAGLFMVFQDIEAETGGLSKTMEGIGRLFGNTAQDADKLGGSMTVVGVITDSLRMILAALGVIFTGVALAILVAKRELLSWMFWNDEAGAATQRTIDFVEEMQGAYVDEAAAIADGFGVRQDRADQEEEMRVAAIAHNQVLADQAGLAVDMAKLTEELTESENKLIGSLLERLDAEHGKTMVLKEGEHWALKATIADEALNKTVRDAARLLYERILANEAMNAALEAEEARLKAVKTAMDGFFSTQLKFEDGVRNLRLVYIELTKEEELNERQLLAMNTKLEEYEELLRTGAIEETNELRYIMGFLRGQIDSAAMSMGLIIGKTTDMSDAFGKLPDVLVPFEELLREAFDTKTTLEFSESIDKLATDFNLLDHAGKDMSSGMMQELQVRFLELSIEMFNAGEDTDEMKAKLEAASIILGMGMVSSAAEAEEALRFFAEQTDETGKTVETTFEKMWSKVTDGMGNAFGEMLFKAKTFRQFMVDTFKGMAKMVIADSFGTLVSGITASLSSIGDVVSEEMGGDGNMVTSFGDAIGNIGEMFTEFNGDTIGLMIGLGMAVFNILKGLFSKDGALEAVMKSMTDMFGGISEELAQKIADVSREIGGAGAQAQFLGEIMDDVGVTVDNFSNFVDIARGSLHAFNAGQIDAAEATATLNDSFALLAAEMENLGIVGDQNVIQLMKEITGAGLEVASVMKFIDDNMRLAAEGLETVVAGALINTEDELGRLGRIASVVFETMIANGSSFIEAMDAIGPSLDIMIEKMKENGLEGDKTFKTLMKWRRLIENNREIVEAFDGLNSIMVGLANTGLLNQEVFDDLLLQAGKLATDLTKAGVKGKDAFILMAPFLDDLIEQAQKHGLNIDDATQKLIDQAEEYGVLGKGAKSETDIMEEGFDLIARAINRLIETLGGIPLALDEIGDDFDNLRDGASDAFDDIAKKGKKAFDDLEDAAEEAAENMNNHFEDVEENLVGNTVFRNIQEKGSAFLEKLGDKAVDVSASMSFGDAEGRIPGVNVSGPVPNFVVSSPTPSLSEGRKGMSKFEQQNLAILGRVVDAIAASGKGGNGTASPGMTSLRQSIGEVIREASLDGDAEFHVDSVGRLN